MTIRTFTGHGNEGVLSVIRSFAAMIALVALAACTDGYV